MDKMFTTDDKINSKATKTDDMTSALIWYISPIASALLPQEKARDPSYYVYNNKAKSYPTAHPCLCLFLCLRRP